MVDGVARVRVYERAFGDDLPCSNILDFLGADDIGEKNVGIDKNAKSKSRCGAEQCAREKDNDGFLHACCLQRFPSVGAAVFPAARPRGCPQSSQPSTARTAFMRAAGRAGLTM